MKTLYVIILFAAVAALMAAAPGEARPDMADGRSNPVATIAAMRATIAAYETSCPRGLDGPATIVPPVMETFPVALTDTPTPIIYSTAHPYPFPTLSQ